MATQRSAEIAQAKDTVEQLKQHLSMNRAKLSDCAKDLIAFVDKEQKKDPFLYKVPESQNPFRKMKSDCQIL